MHNLSISNSPDALIPPNACELQIQILKNQGVSIGNDVINKISELLMFVNDPFQHFRMDADLHHLSEMPSCEICIEYLNDRKLLLPDYEIIRKWSTSVIGSVSVGTSSKKMEHSFLYQRAEDRVVCFSAGQFFHGKNYGDGLARIQKSAQANGFNGIADFLIPEDPDHSLFVLAGRRCDILDSLELVYQIYDRASGKSVPIKFDPL